MEQRNNLVLHGTETFSRGALDNVALESGAVVLDSSAGRYLPYGSYTTPEFAMPECQLECQRPPQHHGRGALPGLCREHLDRLAQLWQVGTGLPPLQHQSPERGRAGVPDGGHRHRCHAGRRHRHPAAGEPFHQR